MIQPRVPRQKGDSIDLIWRPILRNALSFLTSYVEVEYLQGEITEETRMRLLQCIIDLETAIFGITYDDDD